MIGTQMITKGHDFPSIALVGILMADASLNMPDFRAEERTFQVVTQVSGRAGRGEVSGEVVIQTVQPEHPVLKLASQNGMDEFYKGQLLQRQQFGFPPMVRAALIRFQAKNPQRVEDFSYSAANFLKGLKEIPCQILGPAEAPISKIKGLYRWQCLIKSHSVKEIQALLRQLFEWQSTQKATVQMSVDVDPVSMM